MGFFHSLIHVTGIVLNGFFGSSSITGTRGQLFWAYGGAGDTYGPSNQAVDWKVLTEFLNFTQGEATLDCFVNDDSLERVTKYLPNYDDNKQVMLLWLKFPNLFSKSLNSNFSWTVADDQQIVAELTNFVNTPWKWIPPGGLYFESRGKLYDVNGGPFNNNIPANVLSYPEGNTKQASWNWFDQFYTSNTPFNLENMKNNLPLPAPYGDLSFNAATPYTIGRITIPEAFVTSSSQRGFNNMKEIYGVFENLSDNGTTKGFLKGSAFSLGIGINCYMTTDESFQHISMMKDFLTLVEHRYGTPQLHTDNASDVIWKFDVNDALGQTNFVQLLNDLRNGNFAMPLNLSYLSTEGGTELHIHFDFSFYVFNGAQKFALNSTTKGDSNAQSGLLFKLKLANLGLDSVDNKTTVYNIDWRVDINGSPLSPCKDCANVYCNNGQPLINAAGTCGKLITKAYNDVSKNLFLVAQNFEQSISVTRDKMAQLQQALLDNINSIQEASRFQTLIPPSEQAAIQTLKSQIQNLKSTLDQLEQKIHSRLKEFHYGDGQQAFYEYLCESGTSAQSIIGLEDEVEGYFTNLKTFVTTLQTVLQNDPAFADISFTEGKFDLSTVLNDLNSRLADVSNSLNDTKGKAADATQGISDNPNSNTTFSSSNTPAPDDGSSGKTRGFPKWATYVLPVVGTLVVLAVILLVLRFNGKKNYLATSV